LYSKQQKQLTTAVAAQQLHEWHQLISASDIRNSTAAALAAAADNQLLLRCCVLTPTHSFAHSTLTPPQPQ
jgi:hypothetical protein